jgi:peptidoglycan/xylan/chitin deacetylase (PgdA/CDA1 family)
MAWSSLIWRRVAGKFQRAMAVAFERRRARVSGGAALISFTFDDFPCSALDMGASMLEARQWAGTFYASLGLMGQEAPTGKIFDLERLKNVKARGHELGCHTFTHCHAWGTPPKLFEESILRNAKALDEIVPGAVFKSHAYPISCPRPGTKRRVAKYFTSCRGGGQTFNVGRVDLNHLAAFFIEQSRDNLQAVRDLVHKNAQVGGWLIFATHDVSDKPTRFGCTPAEFEKVLKFAMDSGAAVLPVSQALEMALRQKRQ